VKVTITNSAGKFIAEYRIYDDTVPQYAKSVEVACSAAEQALREAGPSHLVARVLAELNGPSLTAYVVHSAFWVRGIGDSGYPIGRAEAFCDVQDARIFRNWADAYALLTTEERRGENE